MFGGIPNSVFDAFSEHRLDNTWVPWANNFKIWIEGIVEPEDRNSTSARNYVWSYSNDTVSMVTENHLPGDSRGDMSVFVWKCYGRFY